MPKLDKDSTRKENSRPVSLNRNISSIKNGKLLVMEGSVPELIKTREYSDVYNIIYVIYYILHVTVICNFSRLNKKKLTLRCIFMKLQNIRDKHDHKRQPAMKE